MQRFQWFVGAVLLIVGAGVAFGQVSSEVAALKKQREKLAKEIRVKQDEYNEARNAVYRGKELDPLQKAMTAASKAVADKEGADPEVQAARKARSETGRALDAAIEAAAAKTPEGAALNKEIDAAKARIKEAEAVVQAAQKKLRDVRAKVAQDPKLADAQKAAKKAGEAEHDLMAKKATAEKEAHKKARDAFDAAAQKKLAADPKATAARQALEELQKKDSEIAKRVRELENPPKAKPEAKKAEPPKPESKKPK